MSNYSDWSSTGEGGSSVSDDKCPERMEANSQMSNSVHNTDHSANGRAFCDGTGTNLNETPLGRSIPESLRDDSARKRSHSIFKCFRLPKNYRKSKSCSHMRQESPREAPPRMEQTGREGICTIDSANAIPSVSNLNIGDSLSGDPLEHAPNLRSVRPLMSCAQFSRRRNSLSTQISLIPMRGIYKSNTAMSFPSRCYDLTEIELQALPGDKEDNSDLNRTAPVIPEEITLTMDESKRVLRASQELLASRHFPTPRKGKELLGGRARTEREETRTGDEATLRASDSVNDTDREQTNFSEISRQISMERTSADVSEARNLIFSELFKSLGRAIEFFDQNEVWKQEVMANEIACAKMEIGHADCLRAQLVKTRKMIESRLAGVLSLPECNQKGSSTVSYITNKAPCTSPIGPSHRPLPNSTNSPKFDRKLSPIISPVHRGTSASLIGTSRRCPNSVNQDDGSPGSKNNRITRRLCTPATGTADQFSEHPSTNGDSSCQTPDTQRPTLESTPRRPFGNRSVSRNQSLDVMPVGVHNSNSGTTCYINAGLQLLSSVPEIFYRVDEGIQFWILEGSLEMEACVAYKKFMEDRGREFIKPTKKMRPINNWPIANMIFKVYPDKFKPSEEADCVEFITLLLQKIHEELGEVHSPSVLFAGAQRRFCCKASRSTGREDDRTNSSNSPPPTKEEFNVIPLHFTARHRLIEDSFDSYTTEESSSDGEFLHWCKFEVLPPLLLVHVQSYDDSKPIPQKALREVPINEVLQFRQEWLYEAPRATEGSVPSNDSFGILISDNLKKDCTSERVVTTPPRYLLRAVVFHDGHRTTTGQYTAAVFMPDGYGQRVWYYCDDHFVKRYSRKALNHRGKISQVTLLLYERDSQDSL